jgi:hypothetical protein
MSPSSLNNGTSSAYITCHTKIYADTSILAIINMGQSLIILSYVQILLVASVDIYFDTKIYADTFILATINMDQRVTIYFLCKLIDHKKNI